MPVGFQAVQAVQAGGAACLVAERRAFGECGSFGARQQMADSQPVRARQMLGRAQPRVTGNHGHAKVFTWRNRMTTRGSVSSTDWQGGIT
jgi:hypothetical protein